MSDYRIKVGGSLADAAVALDYISVNSELLLALEAARAGLSAGVSAKAAGRLEAKLQALRDALDDAREEFEDWSFQVRHGLDRTGHMEPRDYDGYWLRWAVLSRKTFDERYEGDPDWLREALGWMEFYQGPGRPFAHDAYVKVGRNRVLVSYSGGLDI